MGNQVGERRSLILLNELKRHVFWIQTTNTGGAVSNDKYNKKPQDKKYFGSYGKSNKNKSRIPSTGLDKENKGRRTSRRGRFRKLLLRAEDRLPSGLR